MIDIPEERILKEITDILMNDLPKVLLELEEHSEDSIRLLPFRYVGVIDDKPLYTSLPYLIMEIKEGYHSDKDRIIKNSVYTIRLVFYSSESCLKWKYINLIKHVLLKISYTDKKIQNFKYNNLGVIEFNVEKTSFV